MIYDLNKGLLGHLPINKLVFLLEDALYKNHILKINTVSKATHKLSRDTIYYICIHIYNYKNTKPTILINPGKFAMDNKGGVSSHCKISKKQKID